MKTLDNASTKEKAELVKKLNQTFGELEKQIGFYNAGLEELKQDLEKAIESCNEVIADVQSLCETVVYDIDAYMGERSEKWHESDRGQTYGEWKSEWETFRIEEVVIEFPDDLECPENPAEQFDSLPDKVEE